MAKLKTKFDPAPLQALVAEEWMRANQEDVPKLPASRTKLVALLSSLRNARYAHETASRIKSGKYGKKVIHCTRGSNRGRH